MVRGGRVSNTLIIDTDGHPADAQKRLAGEPGGAIPIRIEDTAWLGMNVVVLKGCHYWQKFSCCRE